MHICLWTGVLADPCGNLTPIAIDSVLFVFTAVQHEMPESHLMIVSSAYIHQSPPTFMDARRAGRFCSDAHMKQQEHLKTGMARILPRY